jgi:hypothetical protein
MSGELVKLALAGAAASVLIWVLSFLAPHCAGACWTSDSARGVLVIDIPRQSRLPVPALAERLHGGLAGRLIAVGGCGCALADSIIRLTMRSSHMMS